MDDDIVARLRTLAAEFPTLDGIMDSEWTNAADEIERLRAELFPIRKELADARADRDEARRSVCDMIEGSGFDTKEQIADERGWDCFRVFRKAVK